MIRESRENMRELLERATDFHGHLGPFLVLGVRMGIIARSVLAPKSLADMNALVFVELRPPASCAIDGVQVSSGCTLGKGTIQVSESNDRVAGEFRVGSRTCAVSVKTGVLSQLFQDTRKATDSEMIVMAEEVWKQPDDELFDTTVTG